MRNLLLSTAAIAALSTPVLAADAASVDEVIVTATRLPSAVDEVTGARVIGRAELEARQNPFVTEVLSTVPGVAIARTGAFGGVGAIRIRGAGADKTLVLIDGVPNGDPADPGGAYDPSSLTTDDVERIEVLSGPQGSLWGSEAIGGVVSIVTREIDGWRLSAEGGGLDTLRGFAGVGTVWDEGAVSATVTGFRTDGVSKADTGTEKDGFETVTANLAARLGAFDGKLRYTDSAIDIDGFPAPAFALGDTDDRNESRAWSGFVRARFDALGFQNALSVSGYDLKRKNISDFPAQFDAQRVVVRATAARDGLILGAERQATEADLSGRLKQDLSVTSAFGVFRTDLAAVTLTASARYDEPDHFKGRATGRLSAKTELGAGFALTASAGTGFKIPTISQYACDFCFAPPVALVPEKAEGYDLRLGWTGGRARAALTAYRLNVKDQIAYQGSRYINIARTRSEGLEAEAELDLTPQLSARLAYAWTDAVDRSTNASLIRVPDHSGAASLFWTGERLSGALTVRAESSQSDTARDGFSRVTRKGFTTADVSAGWALNERVTLTARVENLTDETYSESFGYGEPGRTAFVGIRLRN
ncbi:TonB-dependent siderophore receptor [Phenylobacterium sp. J367]|uniref:TonB-dependent receptor plug domain-containing protein n=1 Tax=Phenylobacterium sp. J367 TaxID=2898435 RepID=UPI00215167CA|nr:TonB-dependent receptor [Phenylobacterium sp. J367]MCR5877821.1 TonB-dependent receptor [Phenylobacterium sp. J367]